MRFTPVIDTKPYHDKLTAVKAVIAENIEKIKEQGGGTV